MNGLKTFVDQFAIQAANTQLFDAALNIGQLKENFCPLKLEFLSQEIRKQLNKKTTISNATTQIIRLQLNVTTIVIRIVIGIQN